MAFMGLHNHSEYSNFRLRDSINRIPDLIEYAHKLGHKGIAITEHETIASSLEAQAYLRSKKDDPAWKDFKLALGNEIYLCDPSVNADNKEKLVFPHFILIALDEEGHKQIRELSTKAWMRSFMKNKVMRVPTYYNDLDEIIYPNQGHVIASSACIGGELPRIILSLRDEFNQELQDYLHNWIGWVDETFGHGNFFFEMQPSFNPDQIYVNQQLLKLSQEFDISCIITTDAHYLRKEDLKWQEIFLKSQDADRETAEFYATTYVMSEEEIHSYMDESLGYDAVEKCINNTMLIYDRVQEFDMRRPLSIPYCPLNTEEPDENLYLKYKDKIELLSYFYESDYSADRHLVREIVKSLDEDSRLQEQRTYDSVQECLESIKISSEKMNVHWSAYLLLVSDFVKLAWEAGSLVGPGRGSGVGFILLYLLKITQINPLWENTKTYPWRFLNPERASVLDIDVDICGDKREAVINHFKEVYGADRISKVMTLGREKSRSAIQTVARGLGYSNDLAAELSAMIVSDRGQQRTLRQMYYGDNEFKADTTFKNEIDKYPDIRDAAFKIEGLINGVGSHAGGIILVDKPFTETTALMKTNSGDVITQFDLHMCEDVSLIKVDLLSVVCEDKVRTCIELMLKSGVIEWQRSLKATYEKYLGIYTLERTNKEMWKMLWEHKVISFFQMEKQSGIQAVALCKPESVDDLTALNSVMRLMAQSEGAEQPLEKYARFKNDITLWYKEMSDYGLNQKEQDLLKGILSTSCGICEAQEFLIILAQQPEIGGFSLGWGDRLRRAVAKKKPKDFNELEKEFFQNAKEKNLSKPLVNYVWNVLFKTQQKYAFNHSHVLAYSLIGLQELNLAWKYPIIYWNCANLIVDSGSTSSEEAADKSTNYGKIATAISKMQKSGIDIALPLINQAELGFTPDEPNNRIIYSLKAINGIGDDVVREIISHRPYTSMEDFYSRMIDTKIVKKSQMIQLIKAGCFVELDNPDRKQTMKYFLENYVIKKADKLTLQQFNSLIQFNSIYSIIPKQLEMPIRHKYFKDYVLQDCFLYKRHIDPKSKRALPKCGYNDRWFKLDKDAMEFFQQFYPDTIVTEIVGDYFVISEKKFIKENDKKLQPLRDWFGTEEAVNAYNTCQLAESWKDYAEGTVSKWEMDSLSIYREPHELIALDNAAYGVVDYFQLPEEPKVVSWYTRTVKQEIDGENYWVKKQFPKYEIVRLAGTVIDKDKDKHMLSLLTTTGVVTVKFNKGQYVNYDKTVSEINPDGSKTTIEKSWFARGNKILVSGYRNGDQFRAYKYVDSIYKHTCNLITDIREDGTIAVNTERVQIDG